MDEFLIALPGCSTANAVHAGRASAHRGLCHALPRGGRIDPALRLFRPRQQPWPLSVVVLREAEQALQWAKAAGPESIQCFGDCAATPAAPVAFLSPSSGDELLAW